MLRHVATILIALNGKSVGQRGLLVVARLCNVLILGGASARAFLADASTRAFLGGTSARASRAADSIFARASGADLG